MSDRSSLLVGQLRDVCAGRGLATSGTRAALLLRLADADRSVATSTAASASDIVATDTDAHEAVALHGVVVSVASFPASATNSTADLVGGIALRGSRAPLVPLAPRSVPSPGPNTRGRAASAPEAPLPVTGAPSVAIDVTGDHDVPPPRRSTSPVRGAPQVDVATGGALPPGHLAGAALPAAAARAILPATESSERLRHLEERLAMAKEQRRASELQQAALASAAQERETQRRIAAVEAELKALAAGEEEGVDEVSSPGSTSPTPLVTPVRGGRHRATPSGRTSRPPLVFKLGKASPQDAGGSAPVGTADLAAFKHEILAAVAAAVASAQAPPPSPVPSRQQPQGTPRPYPRNPAPLGPHEDHDDHGRDGDVDDDDDDYDGDDGEWSGDESGVAGTVDSGSLDAHDVEAPQEAKKSQAIRDQLALLADWSDLTRAEKLAPADANAAMRSPGGLLLMATDGSVHSIRAVGGRDSTNSKMTPALTVTVVCGPPGRPVPARGSVAARRITVGLPRSYEELAQFDSDMEDIMLDGKGPDVPERMRTLKEYGKLRDSKFRSMLGDFSPYAGSSQPCQWSDFVQLVLANLLLWNNALLDTASARPFGKLLTEFVRTFDLGTVYVSARTNGAFSGELRWSDFASILRLCCKICRSAEGAEGLCHICHVTGKLPIDPAFLGAAVTGAAAGKAPQPALTAHARTWLTSVAGQAAPARGKIAAYVAAHPGRSAHEAAPAAAKVVSKAVRSDLTSEVFGALLASKQHYIGLSGLKGRNPVRPSVRVAGGVVG